MAGEEVRYGVATVGDPGDDSPTLLCLHGKGADAEWVLTQVRPQDALHALDVDMRVVAVDGSDRYWHPRADGHDPLRMVLDELLPKVAPAGKVALLGWSMGGYGSVLAAATRPERFAAVVAVSPAVFADFASSSQGSFDDEDDFRRHDVVDAARHIADLPLRTSVHCGVDDPFIDGARRLHDALGPSDAGVFVDGAHDLDYWHDSLPAQVRFIADAFASG